MIYFPNVTDKMQLSTSTAAAIVCQVNYIEAVSATLVPAAAGRQNTSISSATTTDVQAVPSSGSNTRTTKQVTIVNGDASLTCVVQPIYNANGTSIALWIPVSLAPGEGLIYTEGVGWWKATASAVNRLLTNMEGVGSQRIFKSMLTEGSTFLTISGTAYYVYMGRAAQAFSAAFVEWHVSTAGAGTETKECGLFSTPAAPNKSGQTLTKIAATGTAGVSTATGMNRNTASFAQAIPAGTHLWAAYRGALGTTQITAVGLANDMSQGQILTTTGGGALTSVTTASGTIPAIATATVAPALRVTLD